ncbi:hypothetical protein C8A05DRAFT_39119, partial [Staphylotrichum tortipilum]
MRITAIASSLLLAGAVSAQTPVGFVPEVKEKLEIIFGTKAVDSPGASLTKAETAKQPTIGTATALNATTYLWMMI